MSLGFVLIGMGAALPASGAPSAPIDVCENQQGTSSDCVDPAPTGSVTTEIRDGGIVFQFQAAEGTQWKRLALCIPGTTPSPANDCDATSASVLDPAAGEYSVSGVTGSSASSTSVSFACTSTLTATVPRDTLEAVANPIPWAVELENCAGGSDEAFGAVERGGPSGADYRCLAVEGLTATSATLRASTTDTTVVKAVFALTAGGEGTYTDDDVTDGISATVTGLTPNTSYAYNVRFFSADGTKVHSEAGCLFATPTSSSTTTSSTTTSSTTSTSTTSTSTTSSTTSTSTTSTSILGTSTSTTEPGSTTTTAQGSTTTTAQGSTTTTAGDIDGEGDENVLPALISRGGDPTPVLAAAAPAPTQLARTGLTSTLRTLGLSLIAFGSLLGFASRHGRLLDEEDPAPVAHPSVPLGAEPRTAPGVRPVVIDERRD